MAAAALEQSMLESKDKDTLLEMAKALGVKANARLKKSDIIDKILDTTGSSNASRSRRGSPGGTRRGAGPVERRPLVDARPGDGSGARIGGRSGG